VSENLFKLWTTQFSTNLELLLQQKGSKLRGRVREGFHVGKQASPVNQLGAIALKAPAGRFAPKNRTDADFVRRWVFPQDGEDDQLIDSFDELKTIVDPKSMYTENVSYAVGRAWDDSIIANSTATAYLGQDANGLTQETFVTANFQIANNFGASAENGLTVAKMIEAKRILRHYHNDLEADALTMVIGSKQESDLLNQVEVVSQEYAERPVLVDGSVKRMLGFDIILSERLPYNLGGSSQDRGVLCFVKSGLYLGIWKDITNRVSIRNDLSSEPYDLYTSVSYGSTRLQPGKVLQILCLDTTGADITP
jgi:hypothetical protein